MSSESSLVDELRALAKVASGVTSFDVNQGGVVVHVDYTGGSSSSLTLSCIYDAYASPRQREGAGPYRNDGPFTAIRPMLVSLRPERPNDQTAKDSGLDVEFQTGDKLFDGAVYIDAPSSEPLARVFSEDVRAGVLALFALEFTEIVIDDEHAKVTARITSFASLSPHKAGPGLAAITAFARLASGLPQVSKRAGAHETPPLSGLSILLTVTAIGGMVAGAPIYGIVSTKDGLCASEMSLGEAATCFLPGIPAVVIAIVIALAAIWIARPSLNARLRGRSDASKRVGNITLGLFFTVFSIVGTTLGFIFGHI